MSFFRRLFRPQKATSDSASAVVSKQVVQLLQHYRFLGELLLQIPRHFDEKQKATMGLSWEKDQLVLIANPEKILASRQDDLQLLLAHEALHVAFQHPLRYANYPHPGMARVATDVAVNQYLPNAPVGTVTLAQLQKLLQKRLPSKADSKEYLYFLEHATIKEKERLRHGGIDLEGPRQGSAATSTTTDSHQKWSTGAEHAISHQQIRLANLQKIVRQALHQTPRRDRGLLPGDINQLLSVHQHKHHYLAWQKILRQQLGLLAAGKESSHARFNRRQPLRLDLPGKVTHLVAQVLVFIDNSGSMPDKEIWQALDEVQAIGRSYHAQIKTYSFDAHVHPDYRLAKRKRIGGGGTSFQAIFDYLQVHHVDKLNTVVIIITDGWGEKQLQSHRYQNVYWLLTTSRDQLSVAVPARRVFELVN